MSGRSDVVTWLGIGRGYVSGLLRGERPLGGVRVFNYHGVVETYSDRRLERNLHLLSTFRDHVRFLQRRRVLSLPELDLLLRGPERELPSAVVITFDDGYRNNLLAAEVLSAARLPWTLFVSTGALGPDACIWTVELSLLLLRGDARSVEVLDKRWGLETRTARESAFQAIRVQLKKLPQAERMAAVETIRRQFPEGERARLLSMFPSMKMLSWEDVRGLDGVEIGSHGEHHEIHHDRQPERVRRRELSESKRAIESVLKRPCLYFAFPNGDHLPNSAAEVKDASYRLAFSTSPGAIERSGRLLVAPRLEPGSDTSRIARRFYWGAREVGG